MSLVTIERWDHACKALGVPHAEGEYRKLVRAWRSWGRRYHTLEHLNACLRHLDEVRNLAQNPAEVEIALWFHDAIYKTHRSDNEAKSSQWAGVFLRDHDVGSEVALRVEKLVLATAHTAGTLAGDAALTVDIDLAILGQPKEIYDEFERNVRREYWWVPKKRFIAGRTAILKSFLDRPTIYHWPTMRDKFESQARVNLARAIVVLASGR